MPWTRFHSNPILPFLTVTPVFSIFLCFMTFELGMELYAGSCILSALISLSFYRTEITWNHYKTILILYFIFGVCALLFDQDHYSSRELRTIFYSSLFILTFPNVLTNKFLFKQILIVSNILLFAKSVYQVHFLDISRVGSYINPIPYATICASTSLMLFVILIFEKRSRFQLLEGLVFICSLVTIIYSGTRGVWFSFLVGLFTILIFCLRQIKQNFSKKSLFIFISALMAITLIMAPIAIKRINRFKEDVKKIKQDNFNSSLGIRIQLWKGAIYTIKKDGIWGAKRSHQKNMEYLVKKGIYSETADKIGHFSHYHNTYLDKLVKYGVQGLGVWLLLAFFPIFSSFSIKNTQKHLFCLILAPTTIYMFASLTDMPFLNEFSFSFYIVVTYILYLMTKSGLKATV